MALSKRAGAIALVVVAFALTVMGIVVAATDTNPGSNNTDALALNGYPPKSADLAVAITTGRAYSVNADVHVNFVTNSVDATVQVPFAFSSINADLRLVNRHLYAGLSNLQSIIGRSWVSTPMKTPSLYGYSLEMTKPDIALISGYTRKTVTTSDSVTTYNFYRDHTTIRAPAGLPVTLPTLATVDFSISVGSQGELTGLGLTVTSKRSTAAITVSVLSYNRPAMIVAPPAKDVLPVTKSILKKLFGASSSIPSLLTPKNVAALGQIRLS